MISCYAYLFAFKILCHWVVYVFWTVELMCVVFLCFIGLWEMYKDLSRFFLFLCFDGGSCGGNDWSSFVCVCVCV